jgi:long-chain acyl-CoA synthetase
MDVQAEGRAGHSGAGFDPPAWRADLGPHLRHALHLGDRPGKPKGVVLSNRNIIETSKAPASSTICAQTDEMLAYLPMAWVGDFIFSIGQAYWAGFCVNCPESPRP